MPTLGGKIRMGNRQPWYATKAGRAEFGQRCAERDTQLAKPKRDFIVEKYIAKPNEFKMCLEHALEIEKAHRQAAQTAGDWWRKAEYWLGADEGRNPTHDEAVRWILMQCPDWKKASEIHLTKIQSSWFGWGVDDIKRMVDEINDRHAEYAESIQRSARRKPSPSPVYVYI